MDTMQEARAPYGHRRATGMDLASGNGRGNGQLSEYRGETYYGQPAIKPSYYGWLVVAYLFIGGLASAAQFIATAVDIFGDKRDRPVVSAGRQIALGGAAISPFLLIADLHTPQRWYNMLRIMRRTSPMSIGSWALLLFGVFSGFAAVGQIIDDLFRFAPARWLARLAGIPAALMGGIVSLYTGTLLAATNTPLWATAFPFLSSLFASSAASTATAALTLAADAGGAPVETRRRLNLFGLVASGSELLFALLIERNWRKNKTGGPVEERPYAVAWRGGVLGLGILTPLAAHLYQEVRGRESPLLDRLVALSTLAGGVLLRAVFVFGGNESSRRPEDYFRITQPDGRRQETTSSISAARR